MRSSRLWSRAILAALCTFTFATVRSASGAGTTFVPAAPKRSLLVVGDSLTVGADSFGHLGDKLRTQNRWSYVRIDALVGRKIPRGIEIVVAQLTKSPATGGFIVALGTNDLMSGKSAAYHAGNAERLIKAAQGKPVLWIDVTYASWRKDWVTKARAFAAKLTALTKKYPNLTVASWFGTFSTTSPFWSKRDGVHLTPTGYRTRATFISSAASSWWKKVTTPPGTTTTTTSVVDSTVSTETPPG